MSELVRNMPWKGAEKDQADQLLTYEWLVTNGMGGYASGTVVGVHTRRYHGLLIAALPAPLGRVMMLNHLSEQLRLADGTKVRLGGYEKADRTLEMYGAAELAEFRLEAGLPVWVYAFGDHVLEKRILLVHQQNTVHVTYRLVKGPAPIRLKLRPTVHFRHHDAPVSQTIEGRYVLTAVDGHYELTGGHGCPPLRMKLCGERSSFNVEPRRLKEFLYRIEESRGYESTGDLHSPGTFRVDLAPGGEATLIGSTESWEMIEALSPAEARQAEMERRQRLVSVAHPAAREGIGAELVLGADQFIITPEGRVEDAARARAAGDEVRTVIAGYHWFTDWGRDTMISLEGLTLATGRRLEAGYILRTFAHYIKDGLIPNMFPDGKTEGLYHTADATLWFFHAIHRYLQVTNDRTTLRQTLPKLLDIVDHHVRGTRFGIGVDPKDGLLRQGAEGYQLTWMDAKVDGWVVTPRRGKAVEINALWYNALRLLEGWLRGEGDDADARRIAALADRTHESFNRRFWYAEGGYLYDVIDGEDGRDDTACRPNQLFAVALDNPVLDRARWEPVIEVARERLLTPAGLRSLAPGHPDYRAKYYGDLRTRDAAYHQGTVWSWLIGPFVDAWLKIHPEDRAGARRFLEGLTQHLGEACVGSVSEVFDAEAPYTARGCVAQAWGVAELLRCWIKTAPEKGSR